MKFRGEINCEITLGERLFLIFKAEHDRVVSVAELKVDYPDISLCIRSLSCDKLPPSPTTRRIKIQGD